jgi:phospholipid transport system substrate-binding protein
MSNRRDLLRLPVLTALSAILSRAVLAQGADAATAFVKTTGDKLVGVVNGPGTVTAKRPELTRIIDGAVDVDGIARFCLGRFWRQASGDQQKRYIELFHQVLVTNITAKLGEYQGVTFSVGRSRQQDDDTYVSTTVERPNNPPTAVDWVISKINGALKIVDVVAEGTSLRLTQRSDYASYLTHNNNNIDALITAMRSQIEQQAG